MYRNLPSPQQADFFQKPVFESREPVEEIDLDRFRSHMKRAMSAAITRAGVSRDQVCEKLMATTGIGAFSRSMLDNYTSEAKQHDISLVRFKALARAVQAPELWDLAVSDEGLLVLQGDEARLAEIARLQQELKAIGTKLRTLKSVPVEIKRSSKQAAE